MPTNPKVIDRIFRGILPAIVLTMVRQGNIAEEHLANHKRLIARFSRHLRKAADETKIYIAVEDGFYRNALKAWRDGDRWVGIVLLATAIEQLLNCHYRFMLEARGFSSEEITKIIRSNNLDAKISWLFTLISGKHFPAATAKKLRFVSELRNSIVHYKAQPDHIDNHGGSHSHISSVIKSCKGWRISEFYNSLERYLMEIVIGVDSEHDIAIKASQIILDHLDERAGREDV